ncbi:hypothetical protein CDCA_CDCA11G3298 [Cyanidium caldarium]|uniref:Uncharacterized protein n=1 Tax=Cyanidium caldarium TaxID=2771 RepID=A0AAV9IZQ4_CYACA|nr:hypothetical protein CDCA_CDCA11G3298 [Cyanidium caldarium]
MRPRGSRRLDGTKKALTVIEEDSASDDEPGDDGSTGASRPSAHDRAPVDALTQEVSRLKVQLAESQNRTAELETLVESLREELRQARESIAAVTPTGGNGWAVAMTPRAAVPVSAATGPVVGRNLLGILKNASHGGGGGVESAQPLPSRLRELQSPSAAVSTRRSGR